MPFRKIIGFANEKLAWSDFSLNFFKKMWFCAVNIFFFFFFWQHKYQTKRRKIKAIKGSNLFLNVTFHNFFNIDLKQSFCMIIIWYLFHVHGINYRIEINFFVFDQWLFSISYYLTAYFCIWTRWTLFHFSLDNTRQITSLLPSHIKPPL